jgi:RNA polymerase primary sigma factor
MGVATLTRGTHRSRRSKPPALTEEEIRLYRQIPGRVGFVYHPSFSFPLTEEKLFGPDAKKIEVPPWKQHSVIKPEETQSVGRAKRTLNPRQEELLFLRYNYARYRLSRLAEAQIIEHFSSKRAQSMIVWHRRAEEIEADIVQANMGLVIFMTERLQSAVVEFGELISEGNMALLRSVRKFDVSRGFKFSTYAYRAIFQSFIRLVEKTVKYRQHFTAEFDPNLEADDSADLRRRAQRDACIYDLRQALVSNSANLTFLEREVLGGRFPMTGERQTLEEVGKRVGLSKERVRQVQNRALGKLRQVLERPRPVPMSGFP